MVLVDTNCNKEEHKNVSSSIFISNKDKYLRDTCKMFIIG